MSLTVARSAARRRLRRRDPRLSIKQEFLTVSTEDPSAGWLELDDPVELAAGAHDPVHQGETLRDCLADLRVSVYAVAKAIRVPVNRVTAILAGRRAMAAASVPRLACCFGSSAECSLSLQAGYDLEVPWARHGAKIEAEAQPQAAWPVARGASAAAVQFSGTAAGAVRTLPLRITTWNVNSVRLRLGGLERLARTVVPDVLCLQETKVRNEAFPLADLEALGYRHHVLHGQAGYNGVAIFSKLPLEDAAPLDWCGKPDCRHLRARLPGGLDVHNLYIPAGGDLPDPELNPKFRHKLEMLDALTGWFRQESDATRRALLLGDLNVAPLESDVWNHRLLLKVVSHTPVEVAALGALRSSHQWVDAVRRFVPPSERLYSWWSYRARDWSQSDRGRRLDHVWATPALAPSLQRASVLRAARGWPQPSDHVPVTVELADG